MSDELKPCNYCEDGGEPRIVSDGFFYVAGCNECGYTMGAYYTKESAIAAWNTRADDVPKQPVDNAQADSREKLEADVRNQTTCSWVTAPLWKVIDWLDRQVAITSREWCHSHDALEEELDRVRAERNELQDKVDTLTAERDELETKHERIVQEMVDANTRQCERTNELTAERDELNTRCNATEAERDDLRRITKELEERNGGLLEGRAHWIDQAVSIYRRFYPHNEYAVPSDVSSMVIAKIDELTAERDEWKLRFEGMCDTRADDAPKRTCELEETESYECRRFGTAEPKLYATRLTVHVLECSECGRTCEHVNGTYPRCPYCSAVNMLDENYGPQVIKNAENYKLAEGSEPQVIATSEKHKSVDEPDSREQLEADVYDGF
jgi:hypothetical protein